MRAPPTPAGPSVFILHTAGTALLMPGTHIPDNMLVASVVAHYR
jgi:hypothetical protein